MNQSATVPNTVPKPSDADEHWLQEGRSLRRDLTEKLWALGEWARAKPEGVTDDQAAALSGFAVGTIRACRCLSAKFPAARRRPELSHTHHAGVAALPDETADRLLDQAIEEGWKVPDIRRAARLAKAGIEADALAARKRDTAAAKDWNAEAHRAIRDCNKLLIEGMAALRSAEAAVAALGEHPGCGDVHGNRVRGVVEQLRAVFGAFEYEAGEFLARAPDRFLCLQKGVPA